MISSAVAKLTPSATLAITAKAKQLILSGKKIVSFAAGQPDFDTPEEIKDACKQALDEGFTKYTVTSGIVELKQAIVEKLKRENGLEYQLSQVIVSNGAKQVLFEAIMSLVNPRDEVVIKSPFWVSFPEMVKAVGGKPVIIEKWQDLEGKINKNTKAVIVNSPSNPTGEILNLKELKEISKAVLKWPELMVISDECYDCFYYGNDKQVSIASLSKEIYKKTLTVNALSKTFSMTGWRIGYGAGPEKLIKAMSNLQS